MYSGPDSAILEGYGGLVPGMGAAAAAASAAQDFGGDGMHLSGNFAQRQRDDKAVERELLMKKKRDADLQATRSRTMVEHAAARYAWLSVTPSLLCPSHTRTHTHTRARAHTHTRTHTHTHTHARTHTKRT